MSFVRNLFRHDKAQHTSVAERPEPPCPHVALIPRWDSTEDVGNQDKVSRYTCEACSASFTSEEGAKLRAEEAERVRLLATKDSKTTA